MVDPVERKDVLDTLTEFRNGIFHDKNLTRDNKHDWEAAYEMHTLHDRLYRLPRAVPKTAYHKITKAEGWGEDFHICSECDKIIPFIDHCQPYCSGCGAYFEDWMDYCRKENEDADSNSEEPSETSSE